jgi:hypothetical protein
MKWLQNISFALLLFMLCIPFLYQQTKFKWAPQLDGYIPPKDTVSLSAQTWYDGSFQEAAEEQFRDRLRLRHFLIRLNNQIYYSAFGSLPNTRVIVGNDGYIFEEYFINLYLGIDTCTQAHIDGQLNSLKILSDSLAQSGTELIIAIAPNKAALYPGKIPDEYLNKGIGENCYDKFMRDAQDLDLTIWDAHAWFKEDLYEHQYPLFTKGGVHWSDYGTVLAMDSLLNFMEVQRDWDLTEVVIDRLDISKRPRFEDYDGGEATNLLFEPFNDSAYAYSDFSFTPGTYKPNVVVVSDSYFWNMYNHDFLTEACSEQSDFFYYFNDIIGRGSGKDNIGMISDLRADIESRDVVILMCTAANLHRVGFGFVETLLEHYPEKEIQ